MNNLFRARRRPQYTVWDASYIWLRREDLPPDLPKRCQIECREGSIKVLINMATEILLAEHGVGLYWPRGKGM